VRSSKNLLTESCNLLTEHRWHAKEDVRDEDWVEVSSKTVGLLCKPRLTRESLSELVCQEGPPRCRALSEPSEAKDAFYAEV
jgi:hypothetical protein